MSNFTFTSVSQWTSHLMSRFKSEMTLASIVIELQDTLMIRKSNDFTKIALVHVLNWAEKDKKKVHKIMIYLTHVVNNTISMEYKKLRIRLTICSIFICNVLKYDCN